ncbi:MAG: hypothetical protein QOH55_1372 [Microbacteriaceae bacterium]|jgi:hypothetical protein|nr:hypothetical protein [Microbacteriaceae bacterium]
MPKTLDKRPSATLPTLPGAAILLRTRRLLFWAFGAALVYGLLGVASKGGCPGGFTGGGGYLNADGQPTDVAPQCVNLTLQPSPTIFAVIAIVTLVAISRVLKSADSEAAAIRTLNKAVIVIVAIVGAWIVISQVSFWMIPITDWDGTGSFFIPFSFGAVNVDISPMNGG